VKNGILTIFPYFPHLGIAYNIILYKVIPTLIEREKDMIDVKDFNTFIPTAKDFEDFVNLLIKNKINFHPEDDFNDYTNQDGSKTFTKDIADIVGQNFDIALQTLSEKVFWKICFDAFRKVNK